MLDGLIKPAEYRDIKKRYEALIDTSIKKESVIRGADAEFKAHLKRSLCMLKNLATDLFDGKYQRKTSNYPIDPCQNLTLSENGPDSYRVRTGKLMPIAIGTVFSMIASIDGAYSPKKKARQTAGGCLSEAVRWIGSSQLLVASFLRSVWNS